jgi:adenosylmethionine-8-amino-7-oxononanoate aminotransferase
MSNADWLTRTQAALWHPCTQMKHLERTPPLPIARGEGPWLVDYDGRRYLDCISSWWVNLFGHANPRINAAITDQLGRIEHAMLAGCTHAPVVALSERLGKLAGLGHAFYGSDGASATEIALKMSFHFWRNVGQTGQDRLRQPAGRLSRRDPGRSLGDRRGPVQGHLRPPAASPAIRS